MATTLSSQQQALSLPNFRDPTTGNWNQQAFSDWAKKAQAVYGGNVASPLSDQARTALSGQGITGQLAVESYDKAYGMAQGQAAKSQEAFGIYSQGMGQFQGALDKGQQTATQNQTTAQGRLKKASDIAEQNAMRAQERTNQVVQSIQGLFQGALDKLDTTKAKDTQSALQATRAQMAQQERDIKQQFGVDSAEYARFKEEKAIGLGNLLAQLNSDFSKNLASMNLNMASTMADVETKMTMYQNYADQAWTETALRTAELANAYDVQVEAYQLNLEQMRMAGMTDYANYLTEIPEFGVDLNPLLSIMATMDIQRQQIEAQQAMNTENNATQMKIASMGGGGRGTRTTVVNPGPVDQYSTPGWSRSSGYVS